MKKVIVAIIILVAIGYGYSVAPEVEGFPLNTGSDTLCTPTAIHYGDDIFIGTGSSDGKFHIVSILTHTNTEIVLDGTIHYAASVYENTFIVQTINGLVYRIDLNGDIMPGFPVDLDGSSLYSGTCINTEYEIIAICDNNIYTITASGEPTLIASFDSEYGAVASPACGDIDQNGIPDVIVVGWDKLFAFSLDDGSPIESFPVELEGSFRFSYSSPVIVDMGHDGDLQVVVGCHQIDDDYWGGIAVASAGVGMELSYPLAVPDTGAWVYSTPVPVDLDNDYIPEITFTCLNGYIYQMKNDRTWLNYWYNSSGSLEGTALISDFDSDYAPDYCFTAKDSGFVQLRDADGYYTDSTYYVNDSVSYGFVSPLVCNDGENWYVVAASNEGIVDIWQSAKAPVIGSALWLHERGNSFCDGIYPEPVGSIEARDYTGEFLLQWTPPLVNAIPIVNYKVYLTNPDDSSETDFQLIYEGFETSLMVETLRDSQDVQVVVEYENGTTSKGQRIELLYGMGISEHTAPSTISMTIAPNPFNSTTQISCPKETALIEIIDINGKIIQTELANSGNVQLTMNCESGVFLVRAISANNIVLSTRRLVYVR